MSPRADRRALGLALLAGPLIWAGQFMLIYSLQAVGCAAHFPLLDVLLHVAALAALVMVGWAGLTAWRGVRTLDAVDQTVAGQGELGGCLALSGVLVSALFGLAILLGDIPVFALRTCV